MQDKFLVKKIIGAAMNVHEVLGIGFDQLIYQNALRIELGIRELSFTEKIAKDVFYKEHLIGSHTIDFLVEETVGLTVLHQNLIEPNFVKQSQKIKESCMIPVGILLNFGQQKLKIIELE